MLPKFVLRQMYAVFAPIDGDILPEVGQLQPRAYGVRLGKAGRIDAIIKMQHQAADRVGGSAAVVQELVIASVAALLDVLLERRKQIIEGRHRQLVALYGPHQRPEYGV